MLEHPRCIAEKCRTALAEPLLSLPDALSEACIIACLHPPTPMKSNMQVIAFCREKGIEFVIVGPEQPLVEGLVSMRSVLLRARWGTVCRAVAALMQHRNAPGRLV